MNRLFKYLTILCAIILLYCPSLMSQPHSGGPIGGVVGGGAVNVQNDVYGAGWNGDTLNAASQNAIYDHIHLIDTNDDFTLVTLPGDFIVSGGDVDFGAIAVGFGTGAELSFAFSTNGTGTAEIVLPSDSIDSIEILDETIIEMDLDVTNVPTDNYLLSYNAAGTNFTWVTAAGGGDVTAAAVMTDHTIVRGDGGAKGVQDTGITIDDSDNISGLGNVTVGSGGDAADAGTIRLKNADSIQFEASPTGTDVNALSVDTSEIVQIGSAGASSINMGAILTTPSGLDIYSGAADVALANAGEIHFNSTDEQISVHSAADGEISGEVAISLIDHISVVVDPGSWYDSDTQIFIMTVGDDYPEGITIDEWKLSCNVDPDVEIAGDLKRATAFIGLGSAAVIDVCDTTAGVASEDTDANINAGAVVANGQVLYFEFDSDPEGTCVQMILEVWFHGEED